MANHMLGSSPEIIWADKRRTQSTGNGATSQATPQNYDSVTNLRTRLAAINGAYFTPAMLDTMTVNDMAYAMRLNDDAASV